MAGREAHDGRVFTAGQRGNPDTEGLEKLVQCVFCLNQELQLKLLRCNHSACVVCLRARQKKFKCPECRLETDGRHGHESFPDNILCTPLERMKCLAEPKSCKLCENFERKTVSSFICLQCNGEPLCNSCVKAHRKMVATMNHCPVPISEVFNGDGYIPEDLGRVQSALDCPIHPGQVFTCFCSTCQVLVCETCSSTAHSSHQGSSMNTVGQEKRDDLMVQLDHMTKDLDNISNQHVEVEQHMSQAVPLADDVINSIRERSEELIRWINELSETLISEIRSANQEQSKLGSKEVKHTRNATIHAEHTLAVTNAFALIASDVEVIKHHGFVTNCLTNLQQVIQKVQQMKEGRRNITLVHPSEEDTMVALRTAMGDLTMSSLYSQTPVILASSGQKKVHRTVSGPSSLVHHSPPRDRHRPSLSGLRRLSDHGTSFLPNGTSPMNHATNHTPVRVLPNYIAQQKDVKFKVISHVEMGEYLNITGMDVSTAEEDICVVGHMKRDRAPCINIVNFQGDTKPPVVFDVGSPGELKIHGSDIYVTDCYKRCVVRMKRTGLVEEEYKLPEKEPGQISELGLAVDLRGGMYVCSWANRKIYYCSAHSRTWGQYITPQQHPGLREPTNVCLTPKQELIVSASGNNNVFCYTPEKRLKFTYEHAQYPRGVFADQLGHIYVADYWNHRVSVMSPSGGLLKHLVTREKHGIRGPMCVALSPNGELLIVAHTDNKLTIFKASV